MGSEKRVVFEDDGNIVYSDGSGALKFKIGESIYTPSVYSSLYEEIARLNRKYEPPGPEPIDEWTERSRFNECVNHKYELINDYEILVDGSLERTIYNGRAIARRVIQLKKQLNER